MKFIVERTSLHDIDIPPCEGAKPAEYETSRCDWRGAATLEEAKEMWWFRDWNTSGTNHREENGKVVCDRREQIALWTIEIADLAELLEFQKKYEKIILKTTIDVKLDSEFAGCIEIFDDYL